MRPGENGKAETQTRSSSWFIFSLCQLKWHTNFCCKLIWLSWMERNKIPQQTFVLDCFCHWLLVLITNYVLSSLLQGFLGGIPSSSFTQDITPIILAAHRDCYEIIKILLDRGDRIPKPHDVRCSCTECVTKSSEDRLNHSRSRINAYRALASPSLVALSSKDPILTAFELSWELKRLSRLENEFRLEYETLAKQCQTFATALLDQTRGSNELETILNHDANGPVSSSAGPGDQSDENVDRMNLARLKLAIKYKQKKVRRISKEPIRILKKRPFRIESYLKLQIQFPRFFVLLIFQLPQNRGAHCGARSHSERPLVTFQLEKSEQFPTTLDTTTVSLKKLSNWTFQCANDPRFNEDTVERHSVKFLVTNVQSFFGRVSSFSAPSASLNEWRRDVRSK